MLYSKYCEYVIRSLSYLHSQSDKNRYVMVREISDKTNIPFHFLQKILQDLISTNWVISKKGKHGGFSLVADANNLKLMDIINWCDGIQNFDKCLISDKKCGEDFLCSMHNKCSHLKNEIISFFNTVTISQVSEMT